MSECETAMQASREQAIRQGGHPSRAFVRALMDYARRHGYSSVTTHLDTEGRLVPTPTPEARAAKTARLLRETGRPRAAEDAALDLVVARLRARRASHRR